MKLKELKNRDLKGWQIKKAFYMELKHSLMGFFPLIEEKTKKIIICINRNDLEKIWNILKPKKVLVQPHQFMINEEEKLCIPLESHAGNEADSNNFLLITNDITKHLKKTKFIYTPGLLSLVEEKSIEFPKENE